VRLRKTLTKKGVDAGAETIAAHRLPSANGVQDITESRLGESNPRPTHYERVQCLTWEMTRSV
jgi:hypothetical protein